MGQIVKAVNDTQPFNIHATMVMPAIAIPSARTIHALENQIHENFLIRSFCGLGDQVCAEPSIRYALNHFKNCDITVESLNPTLYQHLPLAGNFHTTEMTEHQRSQYFQFQTLYDSEHLAWEFLCHISINCVDYPALNMWRSQLPVAERNVILQPNINQLTFAEQINPVTDVVIHAGRNWQSKTIPADFWDQVIQELLAWKLRPVLIGDKSVFDDKGGTVQVNTDDCLDLRNQMSVMETTAVLQKVRCLLTNDSAPLHLAASGRAWIGYISTVKHPDHITHWRKNLNDQNEWGWRMRNHSRGGMWETMNLNPNNTEKLMFGQVEEDLLRSWLPNPVEYAGWVLNAMSGGFL